jgi:membrane protein YdbS with pleckstrin-like domain
MRLITPGDSAPSSVIRYLLPHEAQVITVRRHPAVLMLPVGLVLGGLILAGVLSNTIASSAGSVANLVWWLWLILLGWFVWKVAEWSVDYFVITNQRMILTSGLVTRKVAMMPLSKVTDMSFERSLNGRMLGYGTFVLESAGQDQALRTVPYLPYPEQLYLEVCEMIFPPKAPPSEEDQVQEELDNRMKELAVIDTVLESEGDPMKLTRLNERKDKIQVRVRELHERLEQIAAEKEGTRRS